MSNLEESKAEMVKWIDDLVAEIERMTAKSMPAENGKTPYTRACWALSQLRRLKQYGDIQNVSMPNTTMAIEDITDNLAFIKEILG